MTRTYMGYYDRVNIFLKYGFDRVMDQYMIAQIPKETLDMKHPQKKTSIKEIFAYVTQGGKKELKPKQIAAYKAELKNNGVFSDESRKKLALYNFNGSDAKIYARLKANERLWNMRVKVHNPKNFPTLLFTLAAQGICEPVRKIHDRIAAWNVTHKMHYTS